MKIVDLTGRKIKILYSGMVTSGNAAAFDIAWLDKEIYFLNIASADGKQLIKMTVTD